MSEREFVAKVDELSNVINFMETELKKYNFNFKTMMQLNLAVEEVFVNIANYAYRDKKDGKCKIKIEYNNEKQNVTISFEDNGIKFNPLEKEEPDKNISLEDMKIGGFGIFLVKKNMDNVEYRYEDNLNILKLSKSVCKKSNYY